MKVRRVHPPNWPFCPNTHPIYRAERRRTILSPARSCSSSDLARAPHVHLKGRCNDRCLDRGQCSTTRFCFRQPRPSGLAAVLAGARGLGSLPFFLATYSRKPSKTAPLLASSPSTGTSIPNLSRLTNCILHSAPCILHPAPHPGHPECLCHPRQHLTSTGPLTSFSSPTSHQRLAYFVLTDLRYRLNYISPILPSSSAISRRHVCSLPQTQLIPALQRVSRLLPNPSSVCMRAGIQPPQASIHISHGPGISQSSLCFSPNLPIFLLLLHVP